MDSHNNEAQLFFSFSFLHILLTIIIIIVSILLCRLDKQYENGCSIIETLLGFFCFRFGSHWFVALDWFHFLFSFNASHYWGLYLRLAQLPLPRDCILLLQYLLAVLLLLQWFIDSFSVWDWVKIGVGWRETAG